MRQEARLLKHAGFTLIELVITLVLVGALAAFAVPKLTDVDSWRLRAYGDDLQSRCQELQRLALNQRRTVIASFSSTGASFAYASGASLGSLPCPAGSSPCLSLASPVSASFFATGSGLTSTSSGAALDLTISGGGYSKSYRLENETGLFHALP